jgi:hypothetical protein
MRYVGGRHRVGLFLTTGRPLLSRGRNGVPGRIRPF